MRMETDCTRRPFLLEEAIDILSRTPATLDALLRGLPETWIAANEGGETWSPYDVVGHLIHGELTDWMPRAKIILEHGDARPFDKFDRLAQFQESAARTLDSLLDEFAALAAPQPRRSARTRAHAGRPRSSRPASGARARDARAAPGDLDRARSRSRHADLARPRAAVLGRGRPMASLSADHQRCAGVSSCAARRCAYA